MNTDSMKKAVEAGCVVSAKLAGYNWPEDYNDAEMADNREVAEAIIRAALPHLSKSATGRWGVVGDIVQEICEMDQEDPDSSDAICINVNDLIEVLERHLAGDEA